MDTADLFYLTVTILLIGASVWMIGYMIYTSPVMVYRRKLKALAAIVKKHEEQREAQTH